LEETKIIYAYELLEIIFPESWHEDSEAILIIDNQNACAAIEPVDFGVPSKQTAFDLGLGCDCFTELFT
jgi:hypothetical protein